MGHGDALLSMRPDMQTWAMVQFAATRPRSGMFSVSTLAAVDHEHDSPHHKSAIMRIPMHAELRMHDLDSAGWKWGRAWTASKMPMMYCIAANLLQLWNVS
jgi:hypothetical protein